MGGFFAAASANAWASFSSTGAVVVADGAAGEADALAVMVTPAMRAAAVAATAIVRLMRTGAVRMGELLVRGAGCAPRGY
ncbi:hypothetical protein Shyhy01_16930 [Streptomyces hygroscopicus subsp. hygroscopicus]|nr:hypothetical protein Shyhy01_16930 [Streptomyces hygroscopicus subsp. hygroscopicus]